MISHVSIYAPTAFDKEFCEQINKVLPELSGFKFIIGADFNAVMDHSLDRSGQSENIEQKQASEALQSWTNKGVVDHWHVLNPNTTDFTHLLARHKSKSTLFLPLEAYSIELRISTFCQLLFLITRQRLLLLRYTPSHYVPLNGVLTLYYFATSLTLSQVLIGMVLDMVKQ